jgi:hypothetical protein
MRWYALLSLLSDSRVKFLLWFVVVAVIVAGVLTFIEIRLKKKKERQLAEKADESVLEKMKRFLKYDKTPREKLDFVDKTSKEYFKEVYGTHANSSYSTLIQEFEKNKRKDELMFCKAMFATYYSHKELTDDRAVALGDLLVDVDKRKKRADEISRIPPLMERIERFFARRRVRVVEKRGIRAEKKRIKKIKRKRIAERNKDLRVVLKKEKVVRRNKVGEARAVKRQESKKRRLVNRRTRVLRKQKRKENRNANRLKVIGARNAKKIQAKKARENIKKNRIRRKVIKKKARELIRQRVVHKKYVAKRKKIVAKKTRIAAKAHAKEERVAAIARRKEVIAKRRAFRIDAEKKAKRKEALEIKAKKEKVRLERIASKRRRKFLKRQAIKAKKLEAANVKKDIGVKRGLKTGENIRVARTKILKDEASFKEKKARRVKRAKAAAKKLAREKAKKLRKFRKSQVRKRKVVAKAAVEKKKLDKGRVKKAAVVAKREAFVTAKKLRSEKTLIKKNFSRKKKKFWDIFVRKKKGEDVGSGEERVVGVAERIVNNSKKRAEATFFV